MRKAMAMLAGGAGAVLLMAAAPAMRGGWAVLTVHDLPESVVAGERVTLTFSLRQHGEEMLAGREPTLQLRSGGLLGSRQRVAAERTRQPGVYRATFAVPDGEKLMVRVDTDFHGWHVDLWPIAVRASAAASNVSLASGGHASEAPGQERGRALFIAKGCVGCHTNNDDAQLEDYPQMRVGPELGGRSFPVDFLVRKMTDAASLRPEQPRFGARIAVMPQLEVSADEARAIAGYLNARSVASRD